MEPIVTEIPKESKPVQAEGDVAKVLPIPVTAATTAPTPPIAAEVATAGAAPGIETKPELSAPERIIKDVLQDDHIKQPQPTKTLQQVEVQPKPEKLEQEYKLEPVSKEVADKPVENIPDVTSVPESTIIMKEQDESKQELKAGQITLERKVAPLIATKPTSKEEERDEEPQILPISKEVNDEQVVSDTSKENVITDTSVPVKEEVKAERRRLSFQAMEESSGSELTPSPSPKVQRRRLRVSNVSSSSEDIKTESADSNIEDEEFIRRQIMGMGDEEEMSLSEDEKEEKLETEDAIKDAELENVSVLAKPLTRKSSTEDEGNLTRRIAPKTDTTMTQEVPESLTNTAFKKAIPALRQRQSTDEEVESITESLSKGSSSVQASSFTPGSSPTSASSLEEDSDSSPSHRKVKGEKQHRKGKHRQSTQPLPTIEDSSEEENMEEDKFRKDKDESRTHGKMPSSTEGASSPEDLRQVTVIDDTNRTSGSEYSASMESEPEARRAVQRGCKPSPTVIPYTPSDPFEKKYMVAKPLKSAEETYEEIIQKTKAIPGESPPDIEPLYGGMAIEDYLYESLVEEPELKFTEFQEEEAKLDTASEAVKKLRSPEEVYEEMMQKKRELMMIEQEFQQAQTALESSSSVVIDPMEVSDSCVVTMPTDGTTTSGQTEVPFTSTETSSDMPWIYKFC
ncbi:protein piccolo-like [Cheilinus undulatus]|uniref:protein piccolo-like n=1 Tax=Cheilinus undulatus TaxID=241271 RepID=UPI001BD3EDDA|nr:protein piccolo-like [Cheilinus undulatus]